MISIIHPSRSRPEKAWNTFNKFLNNKGTHVEHILSIDNDDPYFKQYIYLFQAGHIKNNVHVGNNKSAIDAINSAAKITTGNILIVVSDDTDCPNDWGKQVEEITKGKTDWILKTKDGIQDWLITMPVMDRAYYNRFGYIYHPDYRHMFCDTELSCVADLTGRRITSTLLFKHNHYSVTGEKKDNVSVKADSTWEQGKKLFLERYRRNFDLKPDEIKGTIKDKAMINWLAK